MKKATGTPAENPFLSLPGLSIPPGAPIKKPPPGGDGAECRSRKSCGAEPRIRQLLSLGHGVHMLWSGAL